MRPTSPSIADAPSIGPTVKKPWLIPLRMPFDIYRHEITSDQVQIKVGTIQHSSIVWGFVLCQGENPLVQITKWKGQDDAGSSASQNPDSS